MWSLRELLYASRRLALLPISGFPPREKKPAANLVNDVHSQLNPTHVAHIKTPSSLPALQKLIVEADRDNATICLSGARHAMGGQQFLTNNVLVDSRSLNRVLSFDATRGLLRCEAGIMWPQIIAFLLDKQAGRARPWGIAQKQTGADNLCLGGALSANIHGRGLMMRPMIADVETFDLVDARGMVRHCSRMENAELFRLAIGGYGLFGAVYSVTLRLTPRRKLQRTVEIISSSNLMTAFEDRVRDGYLYGDFQFMTDEAHDDFLRAGVFSCYRPVEDSTMTPDKSNQVSTRAWKELVYLAHAEKARAYQLYSDYYLSTSGQLYWSDTHQLGPYLDDYHREVDRRMGAAHVGSEVITEIYVPPKYLYLFLEEVRADFRRNKVNLIYGTIRLTERDEECFLAWAKARYACVIFNLHTEHTPEGREHSARAFRRLIDMAIKRGGSYYLTYHRHATKAQVEACYPQFAHFLERKKDFDPAERFQSDWYRHYKEVFAAPLKSASPERSS
jgi:FAD/FMN-containing dehydrogenase